MKVGDKVSVWWMPQGAAVIAILPYTGRYPQWFNCVLRLQSNTPRGWQDIAWKK